MDLEAFAKQVLGHVREYVQPALREVADDHAALAKRIAALESGQHKTFADMYCGTHLSGKQYERVQLVTCSGSLWLCLIASNERPGNCSHWKLVVQRGKDAKVMTLDEAARNYPFAWAAIQKQIAEFQQRSGASMISTGASLVFEEGIEKLHIETATDIVYHDSYESVGDMGFRTPIASPESGSLSSRS